MLNRRDLLLGTLGFGALGLSGCINVGQRSSISDRQREKWRQCSDFNRRSNRVQWYFNEQVAVILSYGTFKVDGYDLKMGNYAFIYDNPSELTFAKLPMSLLNKGYLSQLKFPIIDGDVCGKSPNLHLHQDANSVLGFLLFNEKGLNQQEINLLKNIVGNELWYTDFAKAKMIKPKGNLDYGQVGSWQATWQNLGLNKTPNEFDEYIDVRHHLFGQKLYAININLSAPKFYTHSFGDLFADKDDGMYIKLSQKGESYDKKAEWASKNQVPTDLLNVAGGRLLYQGEALNNRLDKLALLDNYKRLEKPFGKTDRELIKKLTDQWVIVTDYP